MTLCSFLWKNNVFDKRKYNEIKIVYVFTDTMNRRHFEY
jgi:hypothetical protein